MSHYMTHLLGQSCYIIIETYIAFPANTTIHLL